MANIFDEAIVIVKCDSQLMDNQELKVMKALKLGKLYKELHELIPYMPGLSDVSKLRIIELKKEIEVIENGCN